MTAQVISIRDRAAALGKPRAAGPAMLDAIATIQDEFGPAATIRHDRAHATDIAAHLVDQRNMYGSMARLARLWMAYRYAQARRAPKADVRSKRLWVYVEIRKLRLMARRAGLAKFQPSERVRCTYGEGVVLHVTRSWPERGEPHWRYWVRLDDGACIDAAEANCEAVR